MDDRMRICFISLNFFPLVGGAEMQSERQARHHQALGNEVTVLTLRHYKGWKRTEMLDGLPVVRVGGLYRPGGWLSIGRLGHLPCDIGMFLTLWRLRHQYDLIHVFQASPLAAAAALIGKITHKPVIINIQSAGPNETQRTQLERDPMLMVDTLTETDFLKIRFQDWAPGEGDITYLPHAGIGGSAMLNFLRNANVTYRINSTRCHPYLTSHGFRAEQIVLIPHGVDTEQFRPAPERRPDPARPERDIICVARLEHAKGVDVLLHAWGRMMHASAEWRTHLKPRLRLVGTGVFRPQMERIVAELAIQDSVEFLGLRRDVIDLLQQSWGFVIPSRWESLPSALLEAMACGLPCVATRVSGSEDVISDGINGLLVEPEQPAEMAQALRRLIEDTNLGQRLGKEARSTVVRDYQLENVVKQFSKLYHYLITSSKNGNGDVGASLAVARDLIGATARDTAATLHKSSLASEGGNSE
ncbi:MAG: glycosyltransferase family 4 protein [Ktedonobacteraceae bacterium]